MGKQVTIAAVQFKWALENYKNRVCFQSRIDSIIDDIRSKVDASIPLLVVFPEHIGTPILLFNSYNLVSDKKNFIQAVQSLILANLTGILKYKLRYGISFIRALLLFKTMDMEREYRVVFSSAAKKYNAYIAAGSISLGNINANTKSGVSGSDVFNTSYFIGPDGSIIGKQKKVHLVDFEGKSGFDLSNGTINEIHAFETSFGKIGIAICLDGFKEDVCDALKEKGADILIQPSANDGPWSEWQQQDWLNGSYLAVHERKKFKYAVNAMMNGHILDFGFEGQSSIISNKDTGLKTNYKLLKPVEGFVNVATHHNTEEILISAVEI